MINETDMQCFLSEFHNLASQLYDGPGADEDNDEECDDAEEDAQNRARDILECEYGSHYCKEMWTAIGKWQDEMDRADYEMHCWEQMTPIEKFWAEFWAEEQVETRCEIFPLQCDHRR